MLPRKVKQLAMISLLSLKAKEDRLRVVTDFTVESGKTKDLVTTLEDPGRARSGRSSILKDDDAMVRRAGRNVPWLSFLSFNRLQAHDLFYCQKLLVLETAATKLNEFYAERAARSGEGGGGMTMDRIIIEPVRHREDERHAGDAQVRLQGRQPREQVPDHGRRAQAVQRAPAEVQRPADVARKPKRVRYRLGYTASWKKAIITISPEEKIAIFEGVVRKGQGAAMAIKKYRPLTPGLRLQDRSHLRGDHRRSTPRRPSPRARTKHAGRGAGGRISVRRKGGGHKQSLPRRSISGATRSASPAR